MISLSNKIRSFYVISVVVVRVNFISNNANDMIKKCIYPTSTILKMHSMRKNKKANKRIDLNSSVDCEQSCFSLKMRENNQKMKWSNRMLSGLQLNK